MRHDTGDRQRAAEQDLVTLTQYMAAAATCYTFVPRYNTTPAFMGDPHHGQVFWGASFSIYLRLVDMEIRCSDDGQA